MGRVLWSMDKMTKGVVKMKIKPDSHFPWSNDMKKQEAKWSMDDTLPKRSSKKDFMTSRKKEDQAAEGPTKKNLMMKERVSI